MSRLPLISHRLFVAAIAKEDRAPAQPARSEAAFTGMAVPPSVIPLELLAGAQRSPARVLRPLRASPNESGT